MKDFEGTYIEIFESYYDINGLIISQENIDSFGNYMTEENAFRCDHCGEFFDMESYDGKRYEVDGMVLCEDCLADLYTSYNDGGD